VEGPEFVIGRAEECQLRPRSDRVSRRHCSILLKEGSVVVRDFGSRNGTSVNGEPVKDQRELKSGDRLSVGPLEFEVQLTVSVSGKRKPKVRSIQEAAARTAESAGGADKEPDIDSWLSDDDSDTVAGRPTLDTKTLPARRSTPPAAKPPAPAAAQAPSEPQEPGPDPMTGARQSRPKTVDSRAAADELLRQMMRRP
jgi:predicted component of type VI protein secretion system